MGIKENNILEKSLKEFFKDIHNIYTGGDFREESCLLLKIFFMSVHSFFEEKRKLMFLFYPEKRVLEYRTFVLVKMVKLLDTLRQNYLILTLTI